MLVTMAKRDEDDYGIPLVKNVENADQRTKESLRDVRKTRSVIFSANKNAYFVCAVPKGVMHKNQK